MAKPDEMSFLIRGIPRQTWNDFKAAAAAKRLSANSLVLQLVEAECKTFDGHGINKDNLMATIAKTIAETISTAIASAVAKHNGPQPLMVSEKDDAPRPTTLPVSHDAQVGTSLASEGVPISWDDLAVATAKPPGLEAGSSEAGSQGVASIDAPGMDDI